MQLAIDALESSDDLTVSHGDETASEAKEPHTPRGEIETLSDVQKICVPWIAVALDDNHELSKLPTQTATALFGDMIRDISPELYESDFVSKSQKTTIITRTRKLILALRHPEHVEARRLSVLFGKTKQSNLLALHDKDMKEAEERKIFAMKSLDSVYNEVGWTRIPTMHCIQCRKKGCVESKAIQRQRIDEPAKPMYRCISCVSQTGIGFLQWE